MRWKLPFLVTVLGCTAAVGFAGCGGDEEPEAVCFDYSTFDAMNPAVGFRADVLPTFRNSCASAATCHGDPSAPSGQPYFGPKAGDPDPTDADIMGILAGLGAMSVKEPGKRLVVAGKPEESFLMFKIDGTIRCDQLACAAGNTCGTAMPPVGLIDQGSRDNIRRWIAQGAGDN